MTVGGKLIQRLYRFTDDIALITKEMEIALLEEMQVF